MTGTGFTYGVGELIAGGTYTSILIASDAGFTTPLATYSGAAKDFTLFFVNRSADGLSGGDTISG